MSEAAPKLVPDTEKQPHPSEAEIRAETPETLREQRVVQLMRATTRARAETPLAEAQGDIQESVRQYSNVYRFERFNKSASPLASYPYRIIEKQLSDKEARKVLETVPLLEAVRQERFDLLRGELEKMSPVGRMSIRLKAREYPELFKDFDETVSSLIADGRPRAAEDLMRARATILGDKSIRPETAALFEAGKQRSLRVVAPDELVRPHDEEGVNAPAAMLRFYSDEYVRLGLDTLTSATDFNSRAPTGLKISIAQLQEMVNLQTKSIVRRMRRYLLLAVEGETSHQRDIGLNIYRDELGKTDHRTFSNIYTDTEDVLDFLAAARARFDTGFPDKKSLYGGTAWERIADAAYNLWKTDDPKQLVAGVDRVFQLEHNTSTALDKDLVEFTNITQNEKMLDVKFASKDLPELLDKSYDVRDIPPEIYAAIERRMEQMQAILRLASPYFPEAVSRARTQLGLKTA